jgi:outer membrane protein
MKPRSSASPRRFAFLNFASWGGFASLRGALLLGAVPFFSLPSLASAAGGKSITVVDVQRAIAESRMGKAAREKVESEVKKGEGELQAKQAEVKKLEADIEKQRSLLSGAALEQKEDELKKKSRDLGILLQDKREALERKKQAEVGRVVAEVDKTVKELAKEEGFVFVLERDPRFSARCDRQGD